MKSRDSVCIVGMHFLPETTGNAPYTTAMARALSDGGLAVHVVTGVPHYPQWKVDKKYRFGLRWNERIDGLQISRVRHSVPARPTLSGRVRLESTFFAQTLPIVRRDRSKIVIAISPTLSGLAASVAGLGRRPLGVLVQDLNGNGARESGITSQGVASRISKVEYSLINRADRVGVITPRFGEVLTQNGIHGSKIRLLPNFAHVNPVICPRETSRQRLGWRQDRFTVVHTGNMGRKQGLEVFVEAARLAQGAGCWDFVLVGDGSERSELRKLGDNVSGLRFVDPVSDADYPHVLNAADALVITERAGVKEMSLPSKLTSYAVARRPIVASVEGDGITARLLAETDSALVTASGSPSDLLRGLTTIRMNGQVAQDLSRQSEVLAHTVGNRSVAHKRYLEFALGLLEISAGGHS